MENTNTILIEFALMMLFIILAIATYSQFENMKTKKSQGVKKPKLITSIKKLESQLNLADKSFTSGHTEQKTL